MKKKCDICGQKIKENEIQLIDGTICVMCGRVCYCNVLVSLDEVKKAWVMMEERRKVYNEAMQVKDPNSGIIGVDFEHRLMTLYPQGHKRSEVKKIEKTIEKEGQFLFSFDEIIDYNIYSKDDQVVVAGQISGHNHGLSRALVGGALLGPVGALIGAATSNTTTTNITKTIKGYNYLRIDLNILGMHTYRILSNPPSKTHIFFSELFNKMKLPE